MTRDSGSERAHGGERGGGREREGGGREGRSDVKMVLWREPGHGAAGARRNRTT